MTKIRWLIGKKVTKKKSYLRVRFRETTVGKRVVDAVWMWDVEENLYVEIQPILANNPPPFPRLALPPGTCLRVTTSVCISSLKTNIP